MGIDLARNIIVNVSLLLVLSILYNIFLVHAFSNKRFYEITRGIIIGFLGITLMMNTVSLTSGVIFDTRSILISVTGLFFGFVPTVIATFIIGAYRFMLGGDGAFTGILVTVLAASTGLIWYRFQSRKILLQNKTPWKEFYLFGLVTHLGMLLCMFTLPEVVAYDIISAMLFPILVLYPLGSLFLCIVIYEGFKNMKMKASLEQSELRFRTLVEGAPIGITILRDDNMFYVNSALAKMLGRSKEEIMDMGWKQITHPDDLQQDIEQYNLMVRGELPSYSMVKRYIKADESLIWVKITVASLNIGNQPGSNNICMIQDINDIIKTNQNLKASETKYKNLYHEFENRQILLLSLLNSIRDLIFYKDINGVYIGCNESYEEFTGKRRDQIIGATDYDLFDQDLANLFREQDMEMMKQKTQLRNEELLPYPDGSSVWLETLKTPYYDAAGNILGLIGVSRDITDRKEKEEEILYLNYHDILTGLNNRTYFDRERQRLDREKNLPISIILGDINGLRLINDAFGHEEGDKLLIVVANILKECCEGKYLLARTGGDEFSILLPRTDSIVVKLVVARIKKACEDYANRVGKELYYASISLGEDTKKYVDESLDTVFKVAEEAMNRSKLLESKSMHSSILNSIKTTLFEKSSETERHGNRIGELSRKLGEELGISEKEQIDLELVSTLHDIGKIGIDTTILEKKEKLTADEWDEIKKHPEIGYRIAQTVTELKSISDYILCHHEKWDGSGYPQGLIGEQIPLLARILSIADSYDAMTEDRSYRKAMSKEQAKKEIMDNAGTQFDPEMAKIFVEKVLTK